MKFERSSGIILHPTSLPGKYGTGTLGKEAYFFINFLKATKQKLWQILPVGPTDAINCPYQNTSAFAGNPLLIDVELLLEDGLLNKNDLDTVLTFTDTEANFAIASEFKFPLLKKAYNNLKIQANKEAVAAFDQFYSKNKSWLRDFSLFMALREHFRQQAWNEWEPQIKHRSSEAMKQYSLLLKDEIQYHRFVQFVFYKQWYKLKKYAARSGVKIIGDIPIFISYDSADVWANPELFQIEKQLLPKSVSGVPPDFFSKTGQLWGNPLYDWSNSRKKLFKWWKKRLDHLLKQVDIVRIDHFIGFSRYWSVPYGEKTAVNGKWKNAPGMELLHYLNKKTGLNRLIVEDLGEVTKEVIKLRDHFNLPGMRILQFAFGSDTNNPSLPHHYMPHSVVYTGTHDNDTLVGWYKKLNRNERKFIKNYLDCKETRINWDMIRLAWASVAMFAITPLQDILSLGNEARMNIPGTTAGNWNWRYESNQLTRKIKAELKKVTQLYGRD
jgi:4-alpha-glucanotransferase